MDANLKNAVSACEQNSTSALSMLVPSVLSASSVVPQYKYKNLSRAKVPLFSICIATKSIDCANYLIHHGANIEAEDGLGVQFSFILDQFIGHAYLITFRCYYFFLIQVQIQILLLIRLFYIFCYINTTSYCCKVRICRLY